MKLFLQKNAKFSSAGGSAPKPPKQPPSLRISGYAPDCNLYLQILRFAQKWNFFIFNRLEQSSPTFL